MHMYMRACVPTNKHTTLMTDCVYFGHFALYDSAFKFNRSLHEPYLCDWFIIDFFFSVAL